MAILHPEKIGIGAFEGGDPYDPPGGVANYYNAQYDAIIFNNAVKNVGFHWYHTWHTFALTGDDGSVRRLPAWWQGGQSTAELDSMRANGDIIIGTNEPDSGHLGMTVDDAIAIWPQFMALGNRLAAPSADIGGIWLPDFMNKIALHGYRVDVMNVHYYTRNTNPVSAVADFQTALTNVHTTYGRPIIITEWAMAWFTGPGSSRSEHEAGTPPPFSYAQQIAFMQEALPMLDALDFVELHAWYAATNDGSYQSWNIMEGDGSLTPLGVAFYDVLHGVSFTPSTPLIADFYKNGTLIGTTTQLPDTPLYPAVLLAHTGDAGTANFGATPFAFLPSGAVGWDEIIVTVLSSTDKGPGITLSSGNLTATLSGIAAQSVRANNIGNVGNYFEVTFSNLVTTAGSSGVGVANISQSLVSGYPGNPDGVGYFSSGYMEWPGGTASSYSYSTTTVIGVHLQASSVNFSLNGAFVGTATGLPTGGLYPIILLVGTGSSATVNFGATPFQFTPSGATPWGT